MVDDSEASYLHNTLVSNGTDIPPMPPNWMQDLITASPTTQFVLVISIIVNKC